MPSPTVLHYSNSKTGGLALIQDKTSIFPLVKSTQPPYRQGCVWKILNKDYPLKKDKRIGLPGPVNADQGGTSPCRRGIKPLGKFSPDTRLTDISCSGFTDVGTQTSVKKFDSAYMVFLSSLNGEKRRQELRRVNQENRAILDRITKSQPQYQVQQWHEDWQRAEKYMVNIARYPRGWCKSQRKVTLSSCSFLPGYF